jgi:putative nucleotidyltransferase with HDIG domain
LQYQSTMYEHYYETITALTLMLQRAHPYTHGHLERVARAAEEVAKRLGLSSQRARMVREAAVLHDIGKIAVDEALLDKPGKLTEGEMDHVRKHAEWGAEILHPVEGFREMLPWILHHHERPDGKGYPSQLPDAEIPIESKIIAVVDAFDAMTGGDIPGTRRTYREPMDIHEAFDELFRCSGTQFDPSVVTAFRAIVMEGRY